MKKSALLLIVTQLAAWMLCSPVGLAARHERVSDEVHDIPPGTAVRVLNTNGAVSVKQWDDPRLRVHAVIRTDKKETEPLDVELSIGMEEDTFVVKVTNKKTVTRDSVELAIDVPAHAVIGEVYTDNGAILLDGTDDETRLKTGNGKITIENVNGAVSAETGNGAIEVAGTREIRSLRTSNGAISADIASVGSDVSIDTLNGAVTLRLQKGLDLDIECITHNGSIKYDSSMFESLTTDTRTRLMAVMGNGGSMLHARTNNGRITLEER
ncbi:DUF4097 family beta strand repeat protein [bacterium]|nr:DUF4097 family beta strand repeat protein [candidate division CSSED10-310 bacterium]